MNELGKALRIIVSAFCMLRLAACDSLWNTNRNHNPVVGAWLVQDHTAPFPYHMYVFNGDGTMQQANPDAGDPRTSDSDGKGMWIADGDRIKGKWMEVMADRATHKFAGRLEVSYDIGVLGDTFAGTETVQSYDADGHASESPTASTQLEGKRVTFP